MPPQYWAGRFMALHDRFHNELLEPCHLARICETQAIHSPLSDFTSHSAAAQNNPSTSVYAITRVPQDKHLLSSDSTADQPQPSSHTNRIPQSATSGAILQSTSYSSNPNTHLPNLLSTAQLTSICEHPAPNIPPTTASGLVPEHHPLALPIASTTSTITAEEASTCLRNLGLCTMTSIHNPLPPTTAATTTTTTFHGHDNNEALLSKLNLPTAATTCLATAKTKPSNPNPTTYKSKAKSSLKEGKEKETENDDDEARVRRVLSHLEQLCITDAARLSLRQWRMAYARRTGRMEFLPGGPLLGGLPSEQGQGQQAHVVGRDQSVVRAQVSGSAKSLSFGVAGSASAGAGLCGIAVGGGEGCDLHRNHGHGRGWSGGGRGEDGGVAFQGMGKSKQRSRAGRSDEVGVGHQMGSGRVYAVGSGTEMGMRNGLRERQSSGGQGISQVQHEEQQHTEKPPGDHGHHGHGHEFGRKGREMVRRLKRSLVGNGADTTSNKHENGHGRHEKERAHRGNAGSGDGYSADAESLAVQEKGKGRKGGRAFSFF